MKKCLFKIFVALLLLADIGVCGSYEFEDSNKKLNNPHIDLNKALEKLNINGNIQIDYQYLSDEERADNKFDIRKARLNSKAELSSTISYLIEFELQGNKTQELINAYIDFKISKNIAFRIGQFKVPYSMELQIDDNNITFAERSMGYYLHTGRDVGAMITNDFFNHSLYIASGVFNGDGPDDSTRGNRKDEPEIFSRVLLKPFHYFKIPLFKNFFTGFSFSKKRLNISSLSLNVKSTGMAKTKRNIYVLNSNTKFGLLLDVNDLNRNQMEFGLIWGSLIAIGEYQQIEYTQLKPTKGDIDDCTFRSWYLSLMFNNSSAEYNIEKGILTKNYKQKHKRFFEEFLLALRYESFDGDSDWIIEKSYNSVEDAQSFSIALTWFYNSFAYILFDYTHSDYSNPIRLRSNPDGDIDYTEREDVLTLRFSLSF